MRLLVFLMLLSLVFHAGAQSAQVTLSGILLDKKSAAPLPFVNVILKTSQDSAFVAGTVSGDNGRFSIPGVQPGNYLIEISSVGYKAIRESLLVGKLSQYLDLGTIALQEAAATLAEVTVVGKQDAVAETLDRKTFSLSDNINQSGGSLLQAMQNLPGVTLSDEGTIRLRGNDKVIVLIDGKQTALTGFGNQRGLDNIPASAIDRIEIINNPSARYDANGNAGIINIIYKKTVAEGFYGKVGLAGGLGAMWIKQANYPGIRPQYQFTPKINPSVSINYRRKKTALFLQADNLYTQTLNKNEFTDRYYDDGDIVRQQLKRNRNTNFLTLKGGIDLYLNESNTLTLSGLFGSEKIIDRGDEPFFNRDLTQRQRLWQFLEDELKTTWTFVGSWRHRFSQPGRLLTLGYNYTFHREDEKYFFTNILPDYTGKDSFKLLSDEQVTDLSLDYVQPLRHGRFETGVKFRRRYIPTNMQFFPGKNSPIDSTAGGWANYGETIPALYGNYIFESRKIEVEAGLRVEYVRIKYDVNPEHNTYKSDGYNYTRPFPNLRFAYKINDQHTLSLFYNRRVDRPNEVDIRIFPKYDDAEIIKVGNPRLRPQFTNSFELGYKAGWSTGFLYGAVYRKSMDATIVRIGSTVGNSTLIYNIFQNAGKSFMTGFEILASKDFEKWATVSLNLNGYENIIEAFTVTNQYPQENIFSAPRQKLFSGNVKVNGQFHLPGKIDVQLSGVYIAPDVVPQGKNYARFYTDLGLKKSVQKGKGEIFLNGTDIANTLRIKKRVTGDGFHYLSTDYYETQVFRFGYSCKF